MFNRNASCHCIFGCIVSDGVAARSDLTGWMVRKALNVAFKCLDIGQSVHDPAADLQVSRTFLCPTPALECSVADLPAGRQFFLIHTELAPFSTGHLGLNQEA